MKSKEAVKEAIERIKKRIKAYEERQGKEGFSSIEMTSLLRWDGNVEALKWVLSDMNNTSDSDFDQLLKNPQTRSKVEVL